MKEDLLKKADHTFTSRLHHAYILKESKNESTDGKIIMTYIYLVRHAAYENPKHIFHGRSPGFPLSAQGHEQAKRLASSMSHLPIHAIYTSPLTRTYQTAQAIAYIHGLSIQ